MSEFKGTKRPWGITEGDPNGIELEAIRIQSLNDERWDICAVWNDLYLEESKSNALLISKAPEMLEMLEQMVDIIDRIHPDIKPIALLALRMNAKELIKSATDSDDGESDSITSQTYNKP